MFCISKCTAGDSANLICSHTGWQRLKHKISFIFFYKDNNIESNFQISLIFRDFHGYKQKINLIYNTVNKLFMQLINHILYLTWINDIEMTNIQFKCFFFFHYLFSRAHSLKIFVQTNYFFKWLIQTVVCYGCEMSLLVKKKMKPSLRISTCFPHL